MGIGRPPTSFTNSQLNVHKAIAITLTLLSVIEWGLKVLVKYLMSLSKLKLDILERLIEFLSYFPQGISIHIARFYETPGFL